MPTTLESIRELVAAQLIHVTLHGTRELAADKISLADVIEGIQDAVVVEDYPSHSRGPCFLARQTLPDGEKVHIVWGLKAGTVQPAVLITGYRPDPLQWSNDFMTRTT